MAATDSESFKQMKWRARARALFRGVDGLPTNVFPCYLPPALLLFKTLGASIGVSEREDGSASADSDNLRGSRYALETQ